jgi:hypothetical protein
MWRGGQLLTFVSKKPSSEAQKLLAREIVTDMLGIMTYEQASSLLVSLLEPLQYKSWKKNSEMKERSSTWGSDLK